MKNLLIDRKERNIMKKPIRDLESGELLFNCSDNFAFDSDGTMFMRISENSAMDMDSGELHFVSSWQEDE